MNNYKFLGFAAAWVLLFSTIAVGTTNQRDKHEFQINSTSNRYVYKRMALIKDEDHENKILDEQVKKNEVDDRIVIVEPYRSIIQTSARFALAQSAITRHLNIETAMNLLNNVGYLLSRPVVLLRVLKIVTVTMATLLATTFFFPGAYKFVELAWDDPINALNLDRYLTNGLQERSVLAAIGTKTDETLSRVGLPDNSCRQRSLCYMGEIVKCSFPNTAETVAKFATENFPNVGFKDNVYARAFLSGFVERNCTGIGGRDANETSNCLRSFFSSVLGEGRNQRRRR